ncbi:hypothetical protein ACN268_23975 [Micromonospora sp. WMMD735]|uniref:hypothetical protein n=1 Tax=Micromonospora sp. WMMD735 TaxID=3404130 RepID=UPI003B9441F8
MSPDAAQALGDDRGEVGLQLFRDEDRDGNPPHPDEAVRLIEEAWGEPVALIEHHSDLPYWTAHLRTD